jgi:hypothetical protein
MLSCCLMQGGCFALMTGDLEGLAVRLVGVVVCLRWREWFMIDVYRGVSL